MKEIKIYKYEGTYQGKNGCIVSPLELDMARTEMKRLTADDGMMLTDGEMDAAVIDVSTADVKKWREVERPKEDKDAEKLQLDDAIKVDTR